MILGPYADTVHPKLGLLRIAEGDGAPGDSEMMFSFHVNPALPRLAWIAKFDRDGLSVSAICGNRVECGSGFLVAGVWNGPFSAGDFARTDCFFGTGMIVHEDNMVLVPSAGLNDAIYYAENGACVVAGNSLPLLLAATGDQLDPHFAFYDRISASLRAGVGGYEKCIPTKNGRVRRLFVKNLKVTRSSIEEIDKRLSPPFDDFSSYLRYLTESYASIYRNIRDPDRQHRLDIVSTQSRGYDTTAVNTIASQQEIGAVFTITEAKESGDFVGTGPARDSDDGSDICRLLGLAATRLDRRLYARSFDDEYLFYATTHRAEAAKLLGVKRHLRGPTVMLTGLFGDVIWGTDGLENGGPDTWLHGMSEVGLEWGLVQVFPAGIGERNRSDIYRITMSEEMAPWRLYNGYDRPIPRRIAEEGGRIPRDLFGQRKMATVTEFPCPPVPVGARLRREYFAFLREHRLASPVWRLTYRLVHRINARIIFHTPHRYRYLYYARRFLSKLAGREIEIPMLYRRLDGRLHCFCSNKRVRDYERLLDGAFATGVDSSTAARVEVGSFAIGEGASKGGDGDQVCTGARAWDAAPHRSDH